MKLIKAFLFFTLLANAAKYNLNDLIFLHDEKNYQEFFSRMYDIRPSERGAKWQQLVTNMGRGFIQQNLQLNHLQRSKLKTIEKLSAEPILREDPQFSIDRLTFLKRYLFQCKEQQCGSDLKSFWTAQPKNLDQTIDLVDSISSKDFFSNEIAWSISLEHIYKSSDSEICKHDIIKSQLIQRISAKTNDPTVAEISEKCLQNIKDDIKSHFSKFDNVKRGKMISFLKNKGLDTTWEENLHYLLYYIQDGKKGNDLNMAWNTIVKLGKSYKEREEILSALKGFDPYPDQLFGKLDSKYGRVLLSHFAKNFPEYLDFYLRECQSFLSGNKVFPNGNPTIRCRELVRSSDVKDYLNTSLLNSVKKQFL